MQWAAQFAVVTARKVYQRVATARAHEHCALLGIRAGAGFHSRASPSPGHSPHGGASINGQDEYSPMIRIFISYRRSDSKSFSHRLYERLHRVFGRAVFMDVTAIESGENFPEAINRGLFSSRVLLVVIEKTWLRCTDSEGALRLHQPSDYVRREVATALTRGIRVIPVLVNGAGVPQVAELPEDLKGLVTLNAFKIDDDRFDHDVAKLLVPIEALVSKRPHALFIALLIAVPLLAGLGLYLQNALYDGAGFRLAPDFELYGFLPVEKGGASIRYELVVNSDGRDTALRDLIRGIVTTGAEHADLERLHARQDRSAISAQLRQHLSKNHIDNADKLIETLLRSSLILPTSRVKPGARLRVKVLRYSGFDDASAPTKAWLDCEFTMDPAVEIYFLGPRATGCRRVDS